MSHTGRIIVLIDMDCFYCQVEEKLNPDLQGKPIAVVQYNQWRGGGIIAVNYLAREKGVSRQMRGDEAKKICPDIQLPRVPQVRGKADLTKYREAGKRVAEVLMSFTNVLERASIDEAYMDITDAVNVELKKGLPIVSLEDLNNTYVVGVETADFLSNIYNNQNNGLCDDDLKLVVGGVIVERVRAEVFKKTGYQCSAGIAHNKILAKLVCSLHKPNKQTILPQQAVSEMFSKLPIRKIKSLGGKFGQSLSKVLKINYIGELVKFSEKELIQTFDEKTGRWLYNISRGIDTEPVQIKIISKSIGCCKRFPGRMSLNTAEDVLHWTRELSCEISERLEEDLKENNRRARLMTVSFSQEMNQISSRAIPLKSYEIDGIFKDAIDVLKKNCQRPDGSYRVTFLGLSIGNFEDIKNIRSITSYFQKVDSEKKLNETLSFIGNGKSTSLSLKRKSQEIEEFEFENNIPQVAKLENKDKLNEMEYASGSNCSQYFRSTNDEIQSNYSESTVELDENPDNYVFYERHSKANMSNLDEISLPEISEKEDDDNFEKPLLRCASTSSLGSLENEVNLAEISASDSPVLEKKIQSPGFFTNYFGNSSPPCKRNFDTAKMFTGEETDTSTEDEAKPDVDIDFLKTCEECGEVILITDFLSHMDYHVASKLSKEMYLLPRNQKDVKKTKIEQTTKKSWKKSKVNATKNSITSFFKKSDCAIFDEPSELCPQCNKNIKLSELEIHHDYHVAKQIHLELNNAVKNNLVENPSRSENESNHKLVI